MADYLQENMKKLYESPNKIQAQQLVSQKNSWIKDATYSVTATIAGFGTTVINNLLGDRFKKCWGI